MAADECPMTKVIVVTNFADPIYWKRFADAGPVYFLIIFSKWMRRALPWRFLLVREVIVAAWMLALSVMHLWEYFLGIGFENQREMRVMKIAWVTGGYGWIWRSGTHQAVHVYRWQPRYRTNFRAHLNADRTRTSSSRTWRSGRQKMAFSRRSESCRPCVGIVGSECTAPFRTTPSRAFWRVERSSA